MPEGPSAACATTGPSARSWVLTLPQKVDWNTYMRDEVMPAADGSVALNFRVAAAPKAMRKGDRCYIVWRGRVRGWMTVHAIKDWRGGFRCQATGTNWPPGVYIQRTGPFHPVRGPAMVGFQGVRRHDPPPEEPPLPPGALWL